MDLIFSIFRALAAAIIACIAAIIAYIAATVLVMFFSNLIDDEAHADTVTKTFACQLEDRDFAFSTSIDSKALDIRRTYEYDEDTTYFIYISDLQSRETSATITIEDKKSNKTHTEKSFCLKQ
jgi:hypothetical protein